MKKVINGFDVEIVRATVYPENILSVLSFNADSKEWQLVSTAEKLGSSYTVNNVLELGNEYYRPETTTYLPKAFEREAAEAKALGLDISVDDLKAIDTAILTEFFNKAESMIPTDLQYYNGEDELTSLDKSIQHIIKPLFTTYYYKGVTFSLMPFEFTDSDKVTVKSKIVVGSESLEYTRFNAEDPSNGDCEELDNFLEGLDLEEDIVDHISHIAFIEACEASDA